MEEAFDIPPMDLKASAEQEVRKLQDMVKRLEKQNEILRHSSSQNGAGIITVSKRDSVELEEVTLINLNDSSDELGDSWLYESPVKPATPAQKSVTSAKWAKSLSVDGLDNVRGNLIDKLDDIETQQEISKVRVPQTQEGRVKNAPKNSLFFQPATKTPQRNENSSGQISQLTTDDSMYDNNQLDSSAYGSMDEMDDIPQAPILRRSALGKDSNVTSNLQQNTNAFQAEDLDDETPGPILRRSAVGKSSATKSDLQQNTTTFQLEDMDEEQQGPILRRSAFGKNSPKSDHSKISQSDDVVEEIQGPVLRRSAAGKGSPKAEVKQKKMSQSDALDDVPQGPILRRSALSRDTKTSPQLNGSSESQRLAANTSPGSRLQPRSRMKQITDNDLPERGSLDNSSQSSQDDLDTDDVNDKGPVVRRSALALPKPSSEGLSKQLWYSGPISQMNKQKTKSDSTVARRSVSPSPDRRNKLQPRSPGTPSGIVARRSAGSRGSMEDLLDTDDSAPIQRRSLPQVPTDAVGIKSRAVKPDEGLGNKTQLKPRNKAQNLQQLQGSAIARRSKLATPSNSPKGVVARRKAPSPGPNSGNSDDSWNEGCY